MRTLIVILGVLALASIIYVMDSGLPWENQGSRDLVYFREDNGVMGRLYEFGMDLAWNPFLFAVAVSAVLIGSAGLFAYWRGIED